MWRSNAAGRGGQASWTAPRRFVVVPADANEPQPLAPERTDLGCRTVADGRFGGRAEGSWGTISLQIAGGPQGSRTPDLRRANQATIVLLAVREWRQVPS